MSRLNPPSRARILLPPFPRSNSNRVQQQNPPTKPSYLVESSRICQQMWNYCLLLLPCCCSLLFAIVLVNISTKAVNAVPPDAILFPTSSLAKNFTTALITTTGDSSSSSSQNSSAVVVAAVRAARTKRQYDQGGGGGGGGYGMCPAGCFPCSPMQCQSYQAHCMPQMPRVVNVMSCCCIPLVPAKPDLKTACDGEEAVAGCLNGLCGQGYECSRRRYCCRCKTGKSEGRCVNGLCPSGFTCGDNDYCCPTPPISAIIGQCVNGLCPSGYECDERDNLCHAKGNLGGLGSLVSEAAKERLIDELLEQIAKRRDLDQFLRRAGGYSGGRRTSAGGGGYRESNRGTSSTMNNKKRVPGKSKKKYSLISESWEPQLDDDLAGEEAQLDNNSHAIHTTTS